MKFQKYYGIPKDAKHHSKSMCTWRKHNWTDEKYEYECRKIEAKHKCML